MKKLPLTLTLLAAILCTGLTQSHAQSKLDMHSRMMLRELRSGKADNISMTRAYMPEQSCVEAFIRYTGQDVIPQLEALDVRIIVNLTDLMTCRIPLDRVEQVAMLDGVKLISFAQEMQPNCDRARQMSLIDEVHVMTDRQDLPYTGKGVIYGTIDVGFDFNHPAFKNEDGTSRILCAYLPEQETAVEGGMQLDNYPGFVYANEAIANLTTDNAGMYHGTHTLGIGAGGRNGHDTYYGVAPEADIIVAATSDMLNTTFFNSAKLMIDMAKELGKPISINMSLGNTTGPHDATDLIAAGLDQLTGPGAIISTSIGNDGNNDISLHKPADSKVVTLLYDVNNKSYTKFNQFFVEAWSHDNKSDFTAQLAIVNKENGDIYACSPLMQVEGTDSEDFIYHDPSLMGEAGIWYFTDTYEEGGRGHVRFARTDTTVTLLNSSHAFALIVSGVSEVYINTHGGIALSDGGKPELFAKGNPDASFNSSAAGFNTISVGSYISKNSWTNYAGEKFRLDRTLGDYDKYSSYGTSVDGRTFPDISAPGVLLASATSRYATGINKDLLLTQDGDEHKYQLLEGTSMACPVVAGTIALWLQACPTLDDDDVREVLEHTAIHDEFTDAAPIRFGYGKLDAKAGLDYILNKMSVGISTLPAESSASLTYDLFGNEVGEGYHGIVIRKGMKYIQE